MQFDKGPFIFYEVEGGGHAKMAFGGGVAPKKKGKRGVTRNTLVKL